MYMIFHLFFIFTSFLGIILHPSLKTIFSLVWTLSKFWHLSVFLELDEEKRGNAILFIDERKSFSE